MSPYRETAPDVTRLLKAWVTGDRGALPQVIPLMYDDLRRAAASSAKWAWRNRTMGSTALLHEAYLALERGLPVQCNDRGHFRAIVKRLMQQIAVQHARRSSALKRGGGACVTELDETTAPGANQAADLDLETALDELRRRSPRSHLFVEMHHRAGYSVREIADTTGVAVRTVERELNAGRTWLEERLGLKR